MDRDWRVLDIFEHEPEFSSGFLSGLKPTHWISGWVQLGLGFKQVEQLGWFWQV